MTRNFFVSNVTRSISTINLSILFPICICVRNCPRSSNVCLTLFEFITDFWPSFRNVKYKLFLCKIFKPLDI